MFLDVYAIQNVPPCNINRDDTGTPKTAIYGGYQRARVSSQAWKRAMRQDFASMLSTDELGIRTKHAVELIARQIVRIDPSLEDQAEKLASAALSATGVKIEGSKRSGSEKGTPVSSYLIFIAPGEVQKLARIAVNHHQAGEDLAKPSKEMKKEVSAAFHGVQALDIALFGRMLADAADLNTDASAQVAHAISVDGIAQEYDYFTAVDDCTASDNAGAAMLDTVGYNSSTLYRYATVNIDSLYGQLADSKATIEGVKAFVKAFVRSMPTGKQNTFANRTLPGAVIVSLRNDQPINAVSAFESPVRSVDGESITHQAENRLAKWLEDIQKTYGQPAEKTWWSAVDGGGDELESLGEKVDFPQMVEEIGQAVLGLVAGGEE